MNIPKINSSIFTWSRWRSGSLIDLGIRTRTSIIKQNRKTLNEYAIGWCRGSDLLCRPKSEEVAVMFYKKGIHFWTHLKQEELKIINDC